MKMMEIPPLPFVLLKPYSVSFPLASVLQLLFSCSKTLKITTMVLFHTPTLVPSSIYFSISLILLFLAFHIICMYVYTRKYNQHAKQLNWNDWLSLEAKSVVRILICLISEIYMRYEWNKVWFCLYDVGTWCMPMASVQVTRCFLLSLLLCLVLPPCHELGLSFFLTRSFHLFLSLSILALNRSFQFILSELVKKDREENMMHQYLKYRASYLIEQTYTTINWYLKNTPVNNLIKVCNQYILGVLSLQISLC